MAYTTTFTVAHPDGAYTMNGAVCPTYGQALREGQERQQAYRLHGIDTFGLVVKQVKTPAWRA